MDIADPVSVEAAIARFQPWALINASGYVRVDEAERDADRCFRENTLGPSTLAQVCASHGVHFTTFSSDLVFDGRQSRPYTESSATSPLNVYGQSKARAEEEVLRNNSDALLVRTSAFFGPWDEYNFVAQALAALRAHAPFMAIDNLTVSPTYVPDLVHCCLDLIIDRECGIRHLTNNTAVTWSMLARKAAELAGVETRSLVDQGHEAHLLAAQRPTYSVLGSTRGILLPSLEVGLQRYFTACKDQQEMTKPLYGNDTR